MSLVLPSIQNSLDHLLDENSGLFVSTNFYLTVKSSNIGHPSLILNIFDFSFQNLYLPAIFFLLFYIFGEFLKIIFL